MERVRSAGAPRAPSRLPLEPRARIGKAGATQENAAPLRPLRCSASSFPEGLPKSVSQSVSKRARNALSLRQLDQARWAAVLDTARDAIVSIDRDGIVTLFNRAAEEIFGYSASEVLGENIRMLMPPPYHEEHDQYLQNYHKTHVTKVIGRIRYVEARRKNGEVFPIEVSVSEAQVGDEVLFTAIIRDATERKRMEEALRRERDFAERLVEAAEAIVLVRDLEGRIVLYNPYMEKISGLPLAETKGKNWFSTFLPAPERQRAREVFIQTLCDGEAKAYFGSLLTRGGARAARSSGIPVSCATPREACPASCRSARTSPSGAAPSVISPRSTP